MARLASAVTASLQRRLAALVLVALAATQPVVAGAQPGQAEAQHVPAASETAPLEVEEPLTWFQTEGGAKEPVLGPVEARDPRVIEADSYLSDRDAYDDAVALYRAYLSENEEDDAVRLRLARVISWTGRLDEALVEYDAVVGDDMETIAALERAEVLSWAGRYREAEAAFRSILAANPDNSRAARGLARVFLWSGRSYEADRAYARALEMEDDEETRSEWEGLQSLYRPQVGARAARRSDNDDYFFQSLETHGATYLDLRTRVVGDVSYWRTRGEIDTGNGTFDRVRHEAAAYTLGVERHLSPEWLATAHLGHEAWDAAPDQILAGAELRFTPVDRTSLEFNYAHSGAGRPLESFDAVDEGIRLDTFSLSLWQDLPGRFEFWGRVGGGLLSDSNARVQSEISLSLKPFEDRDLRLHLSNSVLHFVDDSALYYDPHLDIGNEFGAEYVQPLLLGLRVRVESAVGYGLSRDLGRTSNGFVFRSGSYLWWEWRRWALEVGGTFSQSRRNTVYRSLFFTAALTRTF